MELSVLRSACNQLDNDKVSERKKQSDIVLKQLNKQVVLRQLDRNTDDKNGFSWPHLFKAVTMFVILEAESLRKAKTQQASKNKKKQEVMIVLKAVIKSAQQRGPRLRGSDIAKHVCKVLNDEYYCAVFGADYSQILLKDVLGVHQYLCELPQSIWPDLMSTYTQLLLTNSPSFDRWVLARIFNKLIHGMITQCDSKAKGIFPVFQQLLNLESLRTQQYPIKVQESLLSSLNTFSDTFAVNCSHEICHLGEEILPGLIFMWNSRPSELLKDEIVHFCQLQLSCHHPAGALTIEEGATAYDENVWKGLLMKLLNVMYKELEDVGNRSKFSAGSKDSLSVVKESVLSLTADVCHQVFTDDGACIEVTQLDSTFCTLTSKMGPSSKKRKMDVGWTAIRDSLVAYRDTTQLVPWLQLLRTLITKYPGSIPQLEVCPLMSAVCQLYTENKKMETTQYYADFLQAFTVCFTNPNELIDPDVCSELWKKIWDGTLRNIGLHQSEHKCFALLTSILESNLVSPDKGIWLLFYPNLCACSPAALRFLSTYMMKHCLPENYKPTTLVSLTDGTFPLRRQLLEWIMPSHTYTGEHSKPLFAGQFNGAFSSLMAEILVVLSLRDTSCIMKKEDFNQKYQSSYLEEQLLRTKFCLKKIKVPNENLTKPSFKSSKINALFDTLVKKLADECSHFLSIAELEVSTMQLVVHMCCLMKDVLLSMLTHGVVHKADIANLQISQNLKLLMRHLGQHISMFQEDATKCLSPVFEDLMVLFTYNGNSAEIEVVAKLCRQAMPEGVIRKLIKIVKKNLCTQSPDNIRDVNGNTGPPLDLDDDWDDMDMGAGDMGESQQSQESDETNMNIGELSPLSPSQLSDSQTLALQVVSLLCKMCDRDSDDSTAKYIQKQIMNFLNEDVLDVLKPFHLQMFIKVAEVLSCGQHLPDEHVETIVCVIRLVFTKHVKDQRVCSLGLKLMKLMMVHLVDDQETMVTEARRSSREMVSHCLCIFWKRQLGSTYCLQMRLTIVECMQEIIKYDPTSEWSQWSIDDEDTTVLLQLPNALQDKHHAVRLAAVGAIDSIFGSCLDQSVQDELFDAVYDAVEGNMALQGPNSPDEQVDETQNRTSTLLQTLAAIAVQSPMCEKKAVCAFFIIAKEHNVDLVLTKKVMTQISATLQYPSLSSFLLCHLAYIISNWLEMDFGINDFPCQLTECSTIGSFYREYTSILIPFLVMRKDVKTVKLIATCLGEDWKVLLQSNLSKTMVHILPYFAADEMEIQERAIRRNVKHALECYDLLDKEWLPEKSVENAVSEHLDELVVDILKTLHDPPKEGTSSLLEPAPNPPIFNQAIVTHTLDYLTKGHSAQNTTLVSLLCAKKQDGIQNVLHLLAVAVQSSVHPYEKIRKLKMYQIFVKLLMADFDKHLGKNWTFVLRDVIFRMLHIIQSDNKEMSNEPYSSEIVELSCDILLLVCKTGLQHCPEELANSLHEIVSVAVQQMNTEMGQTKQNKFASLLRLLIEDSADLLGPAVGYLDPFPDQPLFTNLRQIQQRHKYEGQEFSLQQELQHFLDCQHQETSHTSVEGLKFLNSQLASRKNELKVIIQDNKELVRSLVTSLLHLCHDNNTDITNLAAQCLGQLGPVELDTTALQLQISNKKLETALKVYHEDPLKCRNARIFHQLNAYLIDTDMHIVSAASQVFKAILASKSGAAFAKDFDGRLGGTDHLIQYLHPFKPGKKKPSAGPAKEDLFMDTVDDADIWIPQSSDFDLWVTNLVMTLINCGRIQDEILSAMGPVCKEKPKFSEMVLPYLIHELLEKDKTSQTRDVFSRHIQALFSSLCEVEEAKSRATTPLPTQGSQRSLSSQAIECTHKAARVVLDVVQYLREQPTGKKHSTAWDSNFWLDIDYLQAAKVAHSCGKHFTALLFTEIKMNESDNSTDQLDTSLSHCLLQASLQEIQVLLLEAYRSIGDQDSVYGCGAGQLADRRTRIQTYEHEKQWNKAVVGYDQRMDMPTMITQTGLLNALHSFGTSHVLNMYLQAFIQDDTMLSPEIQEIQYKNAWKTGTWDLESLNRGDSTSGFNQSIYFALKAVKENDFGSFAKNLNFARKSSLENLVSSNLLSTQKMYPTLSNLLCVNLLEDLTEGVGTSPSLNFNSYENWSNHIPHICNEFEFLEPIQGVQTVLLELLSQIRKDDGVCDAWKSQLGMQAKLACEARNFQVSERALTKLQSLDVSDDPAPWRVQYARLFWAQGECSVAKHALEKLTQEVEQKATVTKDVAALYAEAYGLLGGWMSETRSEPPHVVLKYLETSVKIHEQLNDSSHSVSDAYLTLARFSDSQYQQIEDHMKSPTFEQKQQLHQHSKEEVEKIKQLKDVSLSKGRYYRTLERQCIIDEAEVKEMQDDREKFLLQAVTNYIKCLQSDEQHGTRVFRLMGLWFGNATSVPKVNDMIEESLSSIPSFKFIPMLYQLAARMSTKTTRFQQVLDKLLEKASLDHPHHTVPIILALANAERDTELAKMSTRGKKVTSSQDSDRVVAAKNIVSKLLNSDKAPVVNDLQKLSDAYIQLANFNCEEHKKETRPIPVTKGALILQLKKLKCCVLTAGLKIDPSCEYRDVVLVDQFEPTYKLAGGINLPKIINCVGTDGKKWKQLVKGKDDLRQDAVMQQVFHLVNTLLGRDTDACKRKLNIRTYKVIPLSQRSGLLEWCEGTEPIGQYLVANQDGAHFRYRPKDWSFITCRKYLVECPSIKRKYEYYQTICKNFQPVFRHFFMERFPKPADWYERRLTYTRSVATNSIVGYVLGLGDRHLHNILIDCNTAELVHIDLGVAFEQGRILPTPEMVPFRLTRDVVDPMGVTGVDGVFRRCCEKTMEVMRQSQEELLTVLQVLLHDPLHMWTISPEKAYTLQQMKLDMDDTMNTSTMRDAMPSSSFTRSDTNEEDVNKVAERCLLRLQQKLQGIEENMQMSVNGQVSHLIQEAMDPNNLSRMFPGWMPFV